MDLGEGTLKVRASEERVDDGTWHDVALRRVEREGRVVVDGSTFEFRPPGKDDNCKYQCLFCLLLYIDHPVVWNDSAHVIS